MNAFLPLATAVLVAGLVVPLALPRWSVLARASWRVVTLLLLTLLATRIVGSPLHPELAVADSWDRLWLQLVIAGWWIMAARCLAGLTRLLLDLRHSSRETRILSDLIGAAIYSATILAITDTVFAVPVGGLIATSGVVAVVIGLALQNTLADVFSGNAIDVERPYRAGDMLWVEGGIEGQVQEVYWRSTLVITGNGDIAIVPNSVMAKARLINHSLPVRMRRVAVEIRLDARVMSARCEAVLRAALQACLLPMRDAAADVNLTSLRGDGATYEVAFSVTSSEHLAPARSEFLAQAQRHLFFAAIPLVIPGTQPLPPAAPTDAAGLLAASDLLAGLADEERSLLAAEMEETTFEEGAVLFKQDGPVEALYLVSAGIVGIRRQQPGGGGSEVVRRVSPGGCLGMVGLVTGSPFAATATALTVVRARKLDKAGIARAIQGRLDLMVALEKLALRSQAVIRQD